MNSMIKLNEVFITRLKVFKCALQENLLFRSHGARVLQIYTEAFMIRFTELQQKFGFQPQRMLAVKVRALIGKEWDPVAWGREIWEDPIIVENF